MLVARKSFWGSSGRPRGVLKAHAQRPITTVVQAGLKDFIPASLKKAWAQRKNHLHHLLKGVHSPAPTRFKEPELEPEPEAVVYTHVRVAPDLLVLLDAKRKRNVYVVNVDPALDERERAKHVCQLLGATQAHRLWFVAQHHHEHRSLAWRVRRQAGDLECWEIYAGADGFNPEQQALLEAGYLVGPSDFVGLARAKRAVSDQADKVSSRTTKPKELLYPYMSRLRARAIRGSRRDLTRRPGRHAGYALSMRRTASQVELTDGIVLVRNRDLDSYKRSLRMSDPRIGRLARVYGWDLAPRAGEEEELASDPGLAEEHVLMDEEDWEAVEAVRAARRASGTGASTSGRGAEGISGSAAAGDVGGSSAEGGPTTEGLKDGPVSGGAGNILGDWVQVDKALAEGDDGMEGKGESSTGATAMGTDGQGLDAARDSSGSPEPGASGGLPGVGGLQNDDGVFAHPLQEFGPLGGVVPDYNCELELGPDADDYTVRFNVNPEAGSGASGPGGSSRVGGATKDPRGKGKGGSGGNGDRGVDRAYLEKCFQEEVEYLENMHRLDELWQRYHSNSSSSAPADPSGAHSSSAPGQEAGSSSGSSSTSSLPEDWQRARMLGTTTGRGKAVGADGSSRSSSGGESDWEESTHEIKLELKRPIRRVPPQPATPSPPDAGSSSQSVQSAPASEPQQASQSVQASQPQSAQSDMPATHQSDSTTGHQPPSQHRPRPRTSRGHSAKSGSYSARLEAASHNHTPTTPPPSPAPGTSTPHSPFSVPSNMEAAQQLARDLLGRDASEAEAAELLASLKQASDLFDSSPEVRSAAAASASAADAAGAAAAAAAAAKAPVENGSGPSSSGSTPNPSSNSSPVSSSGRGSESEAQSAAVAALVAAAGGQNALIEEAMSEAVKAVRSLAARQRRRGQSRGGHRRALTLALERKRPAVQIRTLVDSWRPLLRPAAPASSSTAGSTVSSTAGSTGSTASQAAGCTALGAASTGAAPTATGGSSLIEVPYQSSDPSVDEAYFISTGLPGTISSALGLAGPELAGLMGPQWGEASETCDLENGHGLVGGHSRGEVDAAALELQRWRAQAVRAVTRVNEMLHAPITEEGGREGQDVIVVLSMPTIGPQGSGGWTNALDGAFEDHGHSRSFERSPSPSPPGVAEGAAVDHASKPHASSQPHASKPHGSMAAAAEGLGSSIKEQLLAMAEWPQFKGLKILASSPGPVPVSTSHPQHLPEQQVTGMGSIDPDDDGPEDEEGSDDSRAAGMEEEEEEDEGAGVDGEEEEEEDEEAEEWDQMGHDPLEALLVGDNEELRQLLAQGAVEVEVKVSMKMGDQEAQESEGEEDEGVTLRHGPTTVKLAGVFEPGTVLDAATVAGLADGSEEEEGEGVRMEVKIGPGKLEISRRIALGGGSKSAQPRRSLGRSGKGAERSTSRGAGRSRKLVEKSEELDERLDQLWGGEQGDVLGMIGLAWKVWEGQLMAPEVRPAGTTGVGYLASRKKAGKKR